MFESVKNCGAGKFVSHNEWIHPDRVIDSYEIIFVTKGSVYINENGTEYSVGVNEILVLEPNLRHFGYKASTNTEFFWLHWYAKSNLLTGIKHRKTEELYNVSVYLRQLIDARIMQKPTETMDYLTRLILIELYSNSRQAKINPVIERVTAWIKANSNTHITERETAERVGYNADYLNRLFKSNFSKTLKQYINNERLMYIKTLMLTENLPLKEIAAKSGFEEYKYFLKFFKYHEGITPTEFYRKYSKIYINSR